MDKQKPIEVHHQTKKTSIFNHPRRGAGWQQSAEMRGGKKKHIESSGVRVIPKPDDAWFSCWEVKFLTRWWFHIFGYIWYFHPYLRKIPILTNIFQMGWFNHQPAYLYPPGELGDVHLG